MNIAINTDNAAFLNEIFTAITPLYCYYCEIYRFFMSIGTSNYFFI